LRCRCATLVVAPNLPACLGELGAQQRAQPVGATGNEDALTHS
jgi:hypothetical protein